MPSKFGPHGSNMVRIRNPDTPGHCMGQRCEFTNLYSSLGGRSLAARPR